MLLSYVVERTRKVECFGSAEKGTFEGELEIVLQQPSDRSSNCMPVGWKYLTASPGTFARCKWFGIAEHENIEGSQRVPMHLGNYLYCLYRSRDRGDRKMPLPKHQLLLSQERGVDSKHRQLVQIKQQ